MGNWRTVPAPLPICGKLPCHKRGSQTLRPACHLLPSTNNNDSTCTKPWWSKEKKGQNCVELYYNPPWWNRRLHTTVPFEIMKIVSFLFCFQEMNSCIHSSIDLISKPRLQRVTKIKWPWKVTLPHTHDSRDFQIQYAFWSHSFRTLKFLGGVILTKINKFSPLSQLK